LREISAMGLSDPGDSAMAFERREKNFTMVRLLLMKEMEKKMKWERGDSAKRERKGFGTR